MATVAENLATLYANTASELATISATPKMSYTVGDRTFSHTEYRAMLIKSLADIRAEMQSAGGPFLIRSRGRR